MTKGVGFVPSVIKTQMETDVSMRAYDIPGRTSAVNGMSDMYRGVNEIPLKPEGPGFTLQNQAGSPKTPKQLVARLTNASDSQSQFAMLGTVATGLGAAWQSAASGAVTAQAVKKAVGTIVTQALQLHPVVRGAVLVAAGVKLADEAGLFDSFKPVVHEPKNIGGTQHNRMPGPYRDPVELETYGDTEEVRGPTVTGGAELPEALKGNVTEGYGVVPEANQGLVLPGKQMLNPAQLEEGGGFTPINPPQWAENILLAKDHRGDASAEPRQPRLGIADYPKAPKPSVDFSDDFLVEIPDADELLSGFHHDAYFHYEQTGLPKGVDATTDGWVVDGELQFSIHSVGDRSLRYSGGDMLINTINALKQHGVDVYSMRGQWGGPMGADNRNAFLANLDELGATPKDGGTMSRVEREALAASGTFTGAMAKKYGLMPTDVTNTNKSLRVIFSNPLEEKLNRVSSIGPQFMQNARTAPQIQIDDQWVRRLSDGISVTRESGGDGTGSIYEIGGIVAEVTKLESGTHVMSWSLHKTDAIDFRGEQAAATIIQSFLRRAEREGAPVNTVSIKAYPGSPAYEGLKFLKDEFLMDRSEAKENLPIVRALEALDFKLDDLSDDPSVLEMMFIR